jgi:hypothetical protein
LIAGQNLRLHLRALIPEFRTGQRSPVAGCSDAV